MQVTGVPGSRIFQAEERANAKLWESSGTASQRPRAWKRGQRAGGDRAHFSLCDIQVKDYLHVFAACKALTLRTQRTLLECSLCARSCRKGLS